MSNILFIAYDFPPILSPESIQVQRRAITLADNGHHVYIVTAHKNSQFEYLDERLVSNHSNITIINTKKPIFEKILNVFYRLLDLTDRKLWWKRFAISIAKQVIKKQNIEILYTHSTPLVDHLVGLSLKSQFSALTWVAHLSDPWVSNPYKTYKFKWQKSLNMKFEAQVFKLSNKITVTSEKTKELFVKHYPEIENKVSVLPHTFDKNLYEKSELARERKIIVHTGNIYGLRTIKHLLLALKEVPDLLFVFHFYGKIKPEEQKLITVLNLQDKVIMKPQIPYLESLKVISNADYLLVIDAPLENSPFFPSKLADYIGAQKPIIGLTSKTSATVDILNHTQNNDFIASSGDQSEIKELLLKLKVLDKKYTNTNYYSSENYEQLRKIFEK